LTGVGETVALKDAVRQRYVANLIANAAELADRTVRGKDKKSDSSCQPEAGDHQGSAEQKRIFGLLELEKKSFDAVL